MAPHAFSDLDTYEGTQATRSAFIERLAGLSEKLGLETKMRQLGVSKSDLEQMAEDAMRQTRLLVNNPREMSKSDALDIYRAA